MSPNKEQQLIKLVQGMIVERQRLLIREADSRWEGVGGGSSAEVAVRAAGESHRSTHHRSALVVSEIGGGEAESKERWLVNGSPSCGPVLLPPPKRDRPSA